MTLMRPRAARWFSLLVVREDAFAALEALAAAGCVQVEQHAAPPGNGHDAAFAQWLRRFGPYLPPATLRLGEDLRAPADVLASARAALTQWSSAAEPVIDALQRCAAQAAQLQLADAALRAMGDSPIDFALLPQATTGVQAALFALPTAQMAALPARDDVLLRHVPLDPAARETLALVLGPPVALDALAQAVADLGGRRAAWPPQLQPTAQASRTAIAAALAQLDVEMQTQRTALAQLARTHDLPQRLGEVARAGWCIEHGQAIDLGDPGTALLARISGWTTDGAALIPAIDASRARALVALPPPHAWPRGVRPPLTLANPWWAKPFEVFPRLVGMPAASGADPSAVLALAVPLLFGYMFGDVGQGAVLLAAGLVLRRRWPLATLLVPCGIAAIGFGLLFGSVFCLEHVIPALWLHPLQQPLPVLLAPIIGGAGLLALGLSLGLLQAWWQQRTAHWLRDDAPLLAVYLGALLAMVHPLGWALIITGVLGMAAGAVWAEREAAPAATPAQHALAALRGLGELAERGVQLAINTLSFARVGAFALAHAGLASAVVALASAAPHPVLIVLVLALGNVLILAIEGLVVSIQTTRLVLFEFFTRFFEPAGREFQPLQPPPLLLTAPSKEP